MRYSFVIPAYKSRFLREAIDSILAQTVKDFELIVVDDCSPEDIGSIASQYSDRGLRYYRNEKNMGRTDLVESWSHAASLAKGEFLILASDDDTYTPNFLEQAEEMLASHPKCDMIRARVAITDEKGETTDEEPHFDEYQTTEQFAFYLHRYGIRCASNYIYRREAFIARGGFVHFPLAWYTDVATPQVMAANGVLNTQKVAFYFRRSAIQLTHDNNMPVLKQKLDAMLLCWRWQQGYFKTLKPSPLVSQAYYRARIHLVNTTKEIMRHVPFCRVRLWQKFVFRNPLLFGYEKLELVAARIINLLR